MTPWLRWSIPLLAPALGIHLAACGREAPSPAVVRGSGETHIERSSSEEGREHQSQEIRVSPEERAAFGVVVAAASPGRIDSGVELLGAVQPNGDRLAHIVPRFGGIVREVRKAAGDLVRSGDVLATIESSESLAPYELRTLIDGIVITRHLTRGEAVDRERQVFVIADLSNVWVELSVYQKDLARVEVGQAVRVHTVDDGPSAEGIVSYITPALDPETRTATARVVLANPGRRWLPGMFVAGRTLDEGEAAVAIPRQAVQSLGGRSVVFAEAGDAFTPRPVRLGREGETLVEVVSGLSAGERIAMTNTFLLKAELSKAEAEHDD